MPMYAWQFLATPEFASFNPDSTVVILPLAATEQHGPHLPLATDSLINEGYLQEVGKHIPSTIQALVMPTQNIGASSEHINYKGTLSVSHQHLLDSIMAMGASVARAGFKKMVLINSHGGNSPLLEPAARALRQNYRLFVAATSWSRLGYPAGLVSEQEKALGIHGGEIETALMLHLHPRLVRQNRADNFSSSQERLAATNRHLRHYGNVVTGWQMQDLNVQGVVGNAKAATAELGAKLLEHGAKEFCTLLQEVVSYPLQEG